MARPRPFVVLADPRDPRVEAIGAALERHGWAGAFPPAVVGYDELDAEPSKLAGLLGPGSHLRLDAPGRSAAALAAVLRAGIEGCGREGAPTLRGEEIDGAVSERGRLLFSRQWHLGLARLLRRAGAEAAERGAASWSCPEEILLMSDKAACAACLERAGVPVARRLGAPRCYDDVAWLAKASGASRLFLKPRYGSAGAGIVACEFNAGGSVQAWTTAELGVNRGGVKRVYNTRRVRRLQGDRAVGALVDALCPFGVVAEGWVPKAGLHGRRCDVRVVVIGGEPRHAVVRLSRWPITNLHLGGERAEPEALRAAMGEEAWSDLLGTARRVAGLFPRSVQVSLDIAVLPGFRRHAVLEVNAFGDWLRGVLHEGLTTHEAELLHVRGLAGAAA